MRAYVDLVRATDQAWGAAAAVGHAWGLRFGGRGRGKGSRLPRTGRASTVTARRSSCPPLSVSALACAVWRQQARVGGASTHLPRSCCQTLPRCQASSLLSPWTGSWLDLGERASSGQRASSWPVRPARPPCPVASRKRRELSSQRARVESDTCVRDDALPRHHSSSRPELGAGPG